MSHKKKTGRRFSARSRVQIAQISNNRVWLEAAAVGSIQALEDYPYDVCTPTEQRQLARLILAALPLFSAKQRCEPVFISAFCTSYQARIDEYRRDHSLYRRDYAALQRVGAKGLAQKFMAAG